MVLGFAIFELKQFGYTGAAFIRSKNAIIVHIFGRKTQIKNGLLFSDMILCRKIQKGQYAWNERYQEDY